MELLQLIVGGAVVFLHSCFFLRYFSMEKLRRIEYRHGNIFCGISFWFEDLRLKRRLKMAFALYLFASIPLVLWYAVWGINYFLVVINMAALMLLTWRLLVFFVYHLINYLTK